jgi:hypothetical protein
MSRRKKELSQMRQNKETDKVKELSNFSRAKEALDAEVRRIRSNEPPYDYTRFSLLKFRSEMLWEIKKQMDRDADLPSHWFPFAVTFDGRIYRKYWFGWVRTGLTRKSLLNACVDLPSAR